MGRESKAGLQQSHLAEVETGEMEPARAAGRRATAPSAQDSASRQQYEDLQASFLEELGECAQQQRVGARGQRLGVERPMSLHTSRAVVLQREEHAAAERKQRAVHRSLDRMRQHVEISGASHSRVHRPCVVRMTDYQSESVTLSDVQSELV